MLAGLEHPDRGDIRIDGRSVVALEPKDRDVALVFQSYALYPHLSARENIRYPLRIKRMSDAERDRRIAEVAEMLSLTGLLERRAARHSGRPVPAADEPLRGAVHRQPAHECVARRGA